MCQKHLGKSSTLAFRINIEPVNCSVISIKFLDWYEIDFRLDRLLIRLIIKYSVENLQCFEWDFRVIMQLNFQKLKRQIFGYQDFGVTPRFGTL